MKTKDGKVFTIAKGLPGKIVDTTSGGADDHELQWKVQEADDPEFVQRTKEADSNLSTNGYKTIAIAVCEGNARELPNPVWKFVGLVPMLDPPRNDTQATIESLHHANISIKMITGDHQNVGRETARLIGLGTDIRTGQEAREASNQEKRDLIWHADGFASVLPSDKREVVMTLRNEFGVVTGMTGDVSSRRDITNSLCCYSNSNSLGCKRCSSSFRCSGRYCRRRSHRCSKECS